MPSDDVAWVLDREMLGFVLLERLWQDLRYGLRFLARNPGFTAVALVALALGIGANTAIFSVINAVVLRPFPYKDPDRLYVLTLVDDKGRSAGLSPPDFLAWRERTQVFEGMATYWMRSVTLTGVEEMNVEDGRVTLYTRHLETTLAAVFAYARERGISIEDFHVRNASLEDVFLQLTGRRIRE